MSEEIKSGENQGDPAAGESKETTVPLSVVEALREEIKELKDERAVERAMRMQAQQMQNQAPQKGPLDDLEDDDVITGAELKKLIPAIVNPLRTAITHSTIQAQTPDMPVVINVHLPKVLEKKPHLGALLNSITDPAAKLQMAYELGKTDPGYTAGKVSDEFSDAAKKAKENAQKPGSLGNVSGSGSKSNEDRFSRMSDEEIEAHYQKIKFGTTH